MRRRVLWRGDPRRTLLFVSEIAFVLLFSTLAAWLVLDPGLAFGQLTVRQPIPGDRIITQLDTPMGQSRFLLFDSESAETISHESWLIARGVERPMGSSGNVLEVQKCRQEPAVAAEILGIIDAENIGESTARFLRERPVVAVISGAVVLLLGFLSVRLLSGICFGLLSGALSWLGVAAASLNSDIFSVSSESLAAVAVLGFALGLLLGVRRRGVIPMLGQRVASICLSIALAGEIAAGLGWSINATLAVLVVGNLFSPAVGLCFISSWMLALGLHSNPFGTHIILAVTGLIVLTLIASRTGSRLLRQGCAGQVPLVSLIRR